VEVNRAKAAHLGTAPEEVIGKTDFDFFSQAVAERTFADEKKVMESGSSLVDKVEKIVYSDKNEHWASTTKVPWYDDKGKIVGTMGISRDITKRKRAEEELAYVATHDALTGLPNRSLCSDRLSLAMYQAHREGKRVAVMMLDLDWFKRVNDSLGHKAGDELLRAVGHRLKDALRRSDTAARMGGDEFLLLVPGITRTEDATKVARKVLEVFREPFVIDEHQVNVTASVGIAIYPEHTEDGEALIKRADSAMYQVKRSGRNGYRLHNPDRRLEKS
jgi:diguanylate cyclase (GGDEF)-like protein/PAS domain S-box-containing protein